MKGMVLPERPCMRPFLRFRRSKKMIAIVEPKPKIQNYRRYEVDTMHLFNTQAKEEKALCGADVHTVYLTGVDEYLERREYSLPAGNVCEPCKVQVVRWAENRILELESDAGELRVGANELERKAVGCSTERAERNRTRYRNSAEGRRSEADEVEDEARELRELLDRLKKETGLGVPRR